MKNTKTLIIFAASAFAGLLIFRQFYVLPDELPVRAVNKETATEIQTTKEIALSVIENQTPTETAQELFLSSKSTVSHKESVDIAETEESPENQTFMDYEDDWCFLKQLSEADRERAEKEMVAWDASTGQMMPYWNSKMKTFTPHPDDPRLPYLEMSVQELQRYVDNDEPGAMLTALDSNEFPDDHKNNIANTLLILGYTGEAIQRLTSYALLQADIQYKTEGITEKTKHHIRTALAYATYGLNLYDAQGFFMFAVRAKGTGVFAVDLNPTLIFIDEDFEKLAKQADAIHKRITSERQKIGLSPISRELTKAVQHKLNVGVALAHSNAPETIEILASRYEHLFPHLAISECRELRSQRYDDF